MNNTVRKQAGSVARQYATYAGIFTAVFLIAIAVDLLIGPYDDFAIKYLMQGGLAEAVNVGAQAAFVGTAILAVIFRLRRKGPQRNNVWLILGLWHLWLLFAVYLDIPSNIFGVGGSMGTENYLLAINEQLLHYGNGSTWATLWQWLVLAGVLPICVAYCLSVWWACKQELKLR